ncbi:MAG: ABC transporter ATP-binding protein [Lachnospiraceae bacterium]|nr:ABC transporter ATP-binding protein [Lachnospiraceae bacterium]
MEQDVLIELSGIRKSYDGKTDVIESFDLQIREGEFVTFLGPSGCGKTTILRMLGGFEKPTSGNIYLEGRDIIQLPPHIRPINTVFQKYALFPHLNVYENVAFGLKMKKLPKEEIEKKVKRVLDIVDLAGFEKRSISTLSGGQQQRIAIARAVVNEPKVLLLDEPLSALDYKMRKEMQLELKNMHKKLGITFVFVTHDQEEALTMSDKIVVMADGEIQQVGTPEEIYNEPANVFVADFIGESNIFNGTMTRDRRATFAGAEFACVDDFEIGKKIDAVIRPEDVKIVEKGAGQLDGVVTSADFKGTFYITFVQCGQYEMEIHCLKEYPAGTEVGLSVAPDMIHIIPYDTTKNTFEGEILHYDKETGLRVSFGDITWDVDYRKLYPEAVDQNGVLRDENGAAIAVEGRKFIASFAPYEARLHDEESKGTITGTIVLFYYIGDHYSYTVRSKTEEDYVVDDEYLWNQGDFVGVEIPQDAVNYRLMEDDS